ncbi:MAG TPA: VTT domain-containing protein, partial [Thermohalobaculum sp.]|nr:VTT domain-containing protein [Thermohalobaculum sp.]
LAENRDALIEWREENVLRAALVYVVGYAVVVAFSIPGAVWMTIAGGFVFGLVPATLLTTVAATLGAAAVFLAARTSLRDTLRARAGGWLKRLDREFQEGEISFLLVMRLVPIVPFFVANLAPAFLNVRMTSFVWTTFVGIIPGTAVFSSIGAGLGGVIDRGERPDPGVIFEPYVLGPLLGLAALAALPVVVRKWRRWRG